MDTREATDAIGGLIQALQADGADLVVEDASDERVVARLVVTEATCMECILPKASLEQTIQSVIHATGSDARVEVVDPRVDEAVQ